MVRFQCAERTDEPVKVRPKRRTSYNEKNSETSIDLREGKYLCDIFKMDRSSYKQIIFELTFVID